MNLKSRSFASCIFLCVLASAGTQAQKTTTKHDLSGTWMFVPDGTIVTVLQQGDRVEGRIQAPSQELVAGWGWRSGELMFEGSVSEGEISGKKYAHRALDKKTFCPEIGIQSTDLELQVTDPDTLLGRYRNRVTWTNCASTDAEWVAIELSRKKFDLIETPSNIDIALRNGILFDLDKDELKPQAITVLSEMKLLIIDKQRFTRVLIQGHTDDQGSDLHNQDLSARRARAVARWLSQNGLDQNLLEAKGFGKTQPLVPNASEGNRARNRRVEIRLIK